MLSQMSVNRLLKLLPALLPAGGAILTLSGCAILANRGGSAAYRTDQMNLWRQYLGVAVAIQYMVLALALWKAHKRTRLSRLFLSLLFLPIVWTVFGEWGFNLGIWIIGWGWPGKIVAILLSIGGGAVTSSSIYPYLLGAIVFQNVDFLTYWALPSVAASFTVAMLYFSGRMNSLPRKQKKDSA